MRTNTKRSPGAVLGRSGSTGDLTDMEVSAVTHSTQTSPPTDAAEGDWIRFDTYATTLTRWAGKREDHSLNQFVMLAREVRGTSEQARRVVDAAVTDTMCIALMAVVEDGG